MERDIDKKLRLAVSRGDKERIDEAFLSFYKDTSALIGFVLSRYLKDKETIKDLINETYLQFYSHIQQISSYRNYLIQVATHLALDKCKEAVTMPLEEDDFAPSDNASSSYIELMASLRRALSEEEIQILVLHAVYGYSFKEIASLKGKKEEAMKSTYHRAIKRYKKGAKR